MPASSLRDQAVISTNRGCGVFDFFDFSLHLLSSSSQFATLGRQCNFGSGLLRDQSWRSEGVVDWVDVGNELPCQAYHLRPVRQISSHRFRYRMALGVDFLLTDRLVSIQRCSRCDGVCVKPDSTRARRPRRAKYPVLISIHALADSSGNDTAGLRSRDPVARVRSCMSELTSQYHDEHVAPPDSNIIPPHRYHKDIIKATTLNSASTRFRKNEIGGQDYSRRIGAKQRNCPNAGAGLRAIVAKTTARRVANLEGSATCAKLTKAKPRTYNSSNHCPRPVMCSSQPYG